MNDSPIALLAFANNPIKGKELDALKEERQCILDSLLTSKYIQSYLLSDATLGRIEKTFEKYRQKVNIFHFAGHAGGQGIQIEQDGTIKTAFIQGLARYVGEFQGLKLVFLNGCSTLEQVKYLHKKGRVPIVIATREPVEDTYAKDFADLFYKQLCLDKTVSKAFEMANTMMQTRSGKKRALSWNEPESESGASSEDSDSIYLLKINPDFPDAGEETLSDWSEAYRESHSVQENQAVVGQNVYLLCDRKSGNDTFMDVLNAKIAEALFAPQVFFVHGPVEEELGSLNERFIRYTTQEILQTHRDKLRVRSPQVIKFPEFNDFEHKDPKMPRMRLKQEYVKKLRLGHREFEPQMVQKKISRGSEVVFVQHNIVASKWHSKHVDFIKEYLDSYWKGQANHKKSFIIVIFNIIYEKTSGLGSLFNSPEKKIKKHLSELEKREEVTVVERLVPVEKSDVIEWRFEFLPGDELLVDQLFGSKKKLPMKLVQRSLRMAIERNNEMATTKNKSLLSS